MSSSTANAPSSQQDSAISSWRGLWGVETPINGTRAALCAARIVDRVAEIPDVLVGIMLLDQLADRQARASDSRLTHP